MSPLLRKLDAWDAVASVSVRTGFADLTSDASRFPEISAGAAREFGRADLGSLAGLLEETLRPCPGGASAEPGPGGGCAGLRLAASPAPLAQPGAQTRADARCARPAGREIRTPYAQGAAPEG